MFEQQYNEEMEAEVKRLDGKNRAIAAGHPEWENACVACGCEMRPGAEKCERCSTEASL